MAAALHLPAISQVPVAKEFPKVWEHRYNVLTYLRETGTKKRVDIQDLNLFLHNARLFFVNKLSSVLR